MSPPSAPDAVTTAAPPNHAGTDIQTDQAAPRLAIVVPVLDDAAALAALLPRLAPARARGAVLVVVDGGSCDGCADIARQAGAVFVSAPRGRALQMNAGAAAVPQAEALWFVHADTVPPPDADQALLAALARRGWGRFDVRIEGRSRWLPVVAALMNWRSRCSGIATGDQGLFVRGPLFRRLSGYAPIALMEDVAMSRMLKDTGPPACLRRRLVTSGRRWDRHGAWRTIVLMWSLRWRYWRGESPEALLQAYQAPRPKIPEPAARR